MTARAVASRRKFNLGPLYRIPVGEGRALRVEGLDIAVFRMRSGVIYATDAWCTHLGGPLADGIVGNGKVICPLHGYKFSLRTGTPEGHNCPALKTYPVTVDAEGDVVVTLDVADVTDGAAAATHAGTTVLQHGGHGGHGRQGGHGGPLGGRTIGVLEARMADTVSSLFEREGATVHRAPALHEHVVDAEADVREWVRALRKGAYDIVVFLTGVGATRLLAEVERQGLLEAVRDALLRTTVVARGPKPAAMLNRYGVTVSVTVPEPWTTKECIETLRRISLARTRVTLVHYGERNAPLADAIVTAGAILDELCVYEWRLPDDVGPLEQLITAVVGGGIDAVVFTSQVQVRHLLGVSARSGRMPDLVHALNTRTVTASIGPTCSAALVERGIAPHLEPSRPKLGPLVDRVVTHFAGPRRGSSLP